jgi:hypothetical protein
MRSHKPIQCVHGGFFIILAQLSFIVENFHYKLKKLELFVSLIDYVFFQQFSKKYLNYCLVSPIDSCLCSMAEMNVRMTVKDNFVKETSFQKCKATELYYISYEYMSSNILCLFVLLTQSVLSMKLAACIKWKQSKSTIGELSWLKTFFFYKEFFTWL